MIKIDNPSNCCGCTACASICSRQAITMEPDILGFLYPKINTDLCTNCGLCERVCQFHSSYDTKSNFKTPKVFAARHKSIEELEKSQSGGAFFCISEFILESGGVIYGATFNENHIVRHTRATNSLQRDCMRLSKYVQSDLRGVFKRIKEDLRNGKQVLFTGTGCQVAGLKSYIGEKLSANLITIDLVCHGVPSPKIWSDYLAYLEKRYKGKIEEACFRNKKYGWKSSYETFVIKGKEYKRRTSNGLFFSHYSIRESCSNCPYTNLRRVGDITIGDFWGWENCHDEFNDNKGVSLILVNTFKGLTLFDCIKSKMNIFESNTTECIQPQLQRPITLHPMRTQFIKDYTQKGFEYIGKKYSDLGWKYKLKRVLRDLKSKFNIQTR